MNDAILKRMAHTMTKPAPTTRQDLLTILHESQKQPFSPRRDAYELQLRLRLRRPTKY